MSQTKELNIVQLNHSGKNIKKDLIIKEIPFTILINGQEIATILCTPDRLEYLAVGFSLSEGLIKTRRGSPWQTRPSLIKNVTLGKNGYYANVELDEDFAVPQDFFKKRLIGSGCGGSSSTPDQSPPDHASRAGSLAGFYNSRDVENCGPINSKIQISYKQIIDLMKEFQEKSTLFKKTGGVHSASLCNPTRIAIFAEDIGRHNAIDKIFGECLMKKISTENKIILTSGRISSEILIKITKRKIPIIISRAAPTDLAVGLAEKMRITLIGFVRGRRMNIYTHNFRIKQESINHEFH